MEEAASIPLVGLTAWQALIERANLKRGQKVLIHAGSGGVGTFAIQLAKNVGATVATTTSTANVDLVKSLTRSSKAQSPKFGVPVWLAHDANALCSFLDDTLILNEGCSMFLFLESQLEHDAIAVRATTDRCAVQVAVTVCDKWTCRIASIHSGKGMKHQKRAI